MLCCMLRFELWSLMILNGHMGRPEPGRALLRVAPVRQRLALCDFALSADGRHAAVGAGGDHSQPPRALHRTPHLMAEEAEAADTGCC